MEIQVASAWGREGGDMGRMTTCKVHHRTLHEGPGLTWKLEGYIEEEGTAVWRPEAVPLYGHRSGQGSASLQQDPFL